MEWSEVRQSRAKGRGGTVGKGEGNVKWSVVT